jgi:hypothetical protein
VTSVTASDTLPIITGRGLAGRRWLRDPLYSRPYQRESLVGLDQAKLDLFQAERRIAESERRISVHRGNIADRQRRGQDVNLRLFMLATMEEALRSMHRQRELILRERQRAS